MGFAKLGGIKTCLIYGSCETTKPILIATLVKTTLKRQKPEGRHTSREASA